MKKLLTYIPLFLTLVAAGVAIGFAESYRAELVCTDVVITFNKNQDFSLLSEVDVMGSIKKSKKDFIGKQLSDINILELEKNICHNPLILKADCYTSSEGKLHIDIDQREPLVRVIGEHDDFYIDTYGQLMPVVSNHANRLVVATGAINQGYRKNFNVNKAKQTDELILKDLYSIASAIARNTFLQALIEQIYVSPTGSFVLVSKIGPPIIHVGNVQKLDEKLKKIMAFYNSTKVREHWHTYKAINVQFENQIVCTK